MRYTFEEEFRLDHPETVGETDIHFDLDNYKDWLEDQLIEARKLLALYNVAWRSGQLVCYKKCGDTQPSNDICLNCGSSINYNAKKTKHYFKIKK